MIADLHVGNFAEEETAECYSAGEESEGPEYGFGFRGPERLNFEL